MKPAAAAKPRRFVLSIRAQLMLFIGAMTLLSLALVWGVITYALVPQYNRNIHASLNEKAAAITAMIDQSSEPIASRNFGVLALNNEFWQSVGDAFLNKQINVDGCCVDFSDRNCLRRARCTRSCAPGPASRCWWGGFRPTGGTGSSCRQVWRRSPPPPRSCAPS